MRIVFIRHGEPDYAHDCLTETGKVQAAAAAERVKDEGITEIYASPNGRAQETAGYTARKLGLPITTLDYMHEIDWGGVEEELPLCGHPWTLSERMITEDDFDFSSQNWMEHPYFKTNKATGFYDRISADFDALLKEHGLVREGTRYRVEQENNGTLAVFSHGGSGACVLAHLLNLPFPTLCAVMPYDFTSVIILDFKGTKGEYTFPRLELFNDAAHIHRTAGGPKFDK